MTAEQFKNLKVGNFVYLPDRDRKTVTGREVMEIDRFFKKVRVIGGNRFWSYRILEMKTTKPVTGWLGMVKAGQF